jgi:hypothetical protein
MSKVKVEKGAKVVFGEYAKDTPEGDMVFAAGDALILEENDDSGTADNPSFLAKRIEDGTEGYVFLSELKGVSGTPKKATEEIPADEVKVEKPEPKATKTKAASKTKAVVEKVEEPEVVGTVEGVTETEQEEEPVAVVKSDAKSVLASAKEVADRLQSDFFTLGAILCQIAEHRYFETLKDEAGVKLEGMAGFEYYVKQELGIEYRMASHFMSIYTVLSTAGIPESKIKGLKWTKIKQLLKLIEAGVITKGNWGDWAKKIKNVKGEAFREEVESAMVDAGIERNAARGATANQKKYTFVLFDDRAQILDKAIALSKSRLAEEQQGKEVTNSEALDAIVSDWLQAQADAQE